MMNPILQFKRIRCRKGGEDILRDFSLDVARGEVRTILGRSGAGKSTILRLAVGLDDVSDGSVLFKGKDIRRWNIAELRRQMGMVLQLPYLFPGTVQDNLLYGPRIHQRLQDGGEALAAELLERVGLPADLTMRRTADLSVGQQMRVSLARTLANRPDVLLLDEPTASLDAQSERHVLDLIRSLHQDRGIAIVCVTHKMDTACALGGRAVLLENGRASFEGEIEDLMQTSDSHAVQSLLRGSPS